MRAPTAEQAAAIAHPLGDACVTAGAGSGKTTVLTGRFVHLVRRHGISPRRVAALTFTEKAAAQMRERIARAFEEGGDETARAAVEFAPISTIHAFCARILRIHAVEAGVDPAFEVLDEAEAWLLREEAAARAERRLLAEGSADLGVLVRLGTDLHGLWPLLEALRSSARAPEDLAWRRGPRDTAGALGEVRAALDAVAAERDAAEPEAGEALALAVDAARAATSPPPSCARARGAAERVASLPRGRRRAQRALRDALDRLHGALATLEGALLDDEGEGDVTPRVRRLLAALADAYDSLKGERSALDFLDLERGALALLDALAERGRRLEPPFEALLVDEFQDTNPLQARILERLRHQGATQFSVGDPKQSIYRFRRADVRVISRERERVGPAGRHVLPDTFRAVPELVDLLNGLHDASFGETRAGVPFERMRASGGFHPRPSGSEASGECAAEVVIVDAGPDGDATSAREAEADWIARWIRSLVDSGTLRRKVEDGEPRRPLRLGDVALLVRATSDLALYERALASHGIRFHSHKGRGYFLADEIEDLTNLLRVVHDPQDAFAVACACTGPAMGAGDADLLRWFRAPAGPWRALVEEAGRGGPYAEAVRAIEDLREAAVGGSLGDVVEGALRRTGLLETALLQPGGERAAANLRKVLDVARNLDRAGRHGLDDLLRHLSRMRDREIAEAEAPTGGEADDAVRILTVHAAKGLEFPVVVLADLGRKPPVERAPFLHDGEASFAARLRDPLEGDERRPGGYEALLEDERRLQDEEARRLLYVATTRAEERLLLTGWCKGRNKEDGAPKGLDGWGKWVLEALGRASPSDDAVVPVGGGSARVRVVPAVEPAGRSAAVPPSGADAGPASARAAELLREADLPVAPLGGTRFVVTVSELLHFAQSPARFRTEGFASRAAAPPAAAVAGADSDEPPGPGSDDPEAGRREDRAAEFDEERSVVGGIDRAALGRAVHAAVEHAAVGQDAPGAGARAQVTEAALRAALEQEFGPEPPEGAAPLAREMVDRFLRSPLGRRTAQALAGGEDVRREIGFHARIRFADGATVGPFDSLLVKGSIDLWVPAHEGGGVLVVDHKTNPPGARFRTPQDLARHYSWQLRLYALAAERILGVDVAGARLLLLDPGWGPEAVEVPVDVSGPAVEEARRLCRAFAVAEMESRWPADWRMLLPATAVSS